MVKTCYYLIVFFFLIITQSCNSQQTPKEDGHKEKPTALEASELENSKPLKIGAEQLEKYLPWLRGKRVACIVNHSSLIGRTHLIDTLLDFDINVVKIFAPEHGFRGTADAGEHVSNAKDTKTGLPIISLYGKNKNLPVSLLEDVDVLVFDIQDVGTRFYTYISTMHYGMESAAKKAIPFVVLDRPNPNGHLIDGPVLDMSLQSFVGMHPIPIAHGLTVGELAKMIIGEKWISQSLDLRIVPCLNYTHTMRYELPVAPSPNLPNQRSILLYPSLCLLEPTVYSIGRGTDAPFQHYGHPKDPRAYNFKPQPNTGAANPKWKGELCKGVDLRNVPLDSLYAQRTINLAYLLDAWQQYLGEKDFFGNNFFEKIAGTKTLRMQIKKNMSEDSIRKSWEPALGKYKTTRQKYLLYD